MLRFVRKILELILITAVVIVLLQNLFIFPEAAYRYVDPPRVGVPDGIESFELRTLDGERLEAWRLPKDPAVQGSGAVALVFHGNGGNLMSSLYNQRDFQKMGITSYAVDYRGFGKSSGFPTEEGLYRDADALWEYVLARERISPEKIILFGISLGSGPATYLAEMHEARTLVLVAPYSSLPRAVGDRKVLGLLAPFVWIKFPNVDRFGRMDGTCVVISHGQKDVKILPYHSDILRSVFRSRHGFFHIVEENADHNNIVQLTWPRIQTAMMSCFERKN